MACDVACRIFENTCNPDCCIHDRLKLVYEVCYRTRKQAVAVIIIIVIIVYNQFFEITRLFTIVGGDCRHSESVQSGRKQHVQAPRIETKDLILVCT